MDRVRSALLAAVGHDLRTPLSGLKAAVSSLRQDDMTWSPAEEAELLAEMVQAAVNEGLRAAQELASSKMGGITGGLGGGGLGALGG